MSTQTPWLEFIKSLTADFTPHPPASLNEIKKAESYLGVSFPEKLKSLLLESNGVEGRYGFGLVWNVGRIQKDNLYFRQSPDFKNCICRLILSCFLPTQATGTNLGFVYWIERSAIWMSLSGIMKTTVVNGQHRLWMFI